MADIVELFRARGEQFDALASDARLAKRAQTLEGKSKVQTSVSAASYVRPRVGTATQYMRLQFGVLHVLAHPTDTAGVIGLLVGTQAANARRLSDRIDATRLSRSSVEATLTERVAALTTKTAALLANLERSRVALEAADRSDLKKRIHADCAAAVKANAHAIACALARLEDVVLRYVPCGLEVFTPVARAGKTTKKVADADGGPDETLKLAALPTTAKPGARGKGLARVAAAK